MDFNYVNYRENNGQNGWNHDRSFINQQEKVDPNAGYYNQNNDGSYRNQQENVDPHAGYYNQNNDGSYRNQRENVDPNAGYYNQNNDDSYRNQRENVDPNAGYYNQNNDGSFINQQENVDTNAGYYDQNYNANEYNNHLGYDHHPPDVNPPTDYNPYRGGETYGNSGYPAPSRNEYGNNDPYYSTNKSINPGGNSGYPPRNGYSKNDPYYSPGKPTSPGGSAYGGDSGYTIPHNISSHSKVRHKNHGNPYNISSNEQKPPQYSYNTPTHYSPSPVNYPSSPAMRGVNPPHLPVSPIPGRKAPVDPYPPVKPTNPIPGRQVPYGGHQTDPYNEGAANKEMSSSDYSSTPTNSGPKPPSSSDYEKPFSPTSAYSSKPFFPEEKGAKSGGIMRYCCRCGTCGKTCAIICCILIFLIIGIIAAILLWARPPKVDFLGVVPSPQGLPPYNARASGFDFNLGLRIQVDNPNIIGAKFEMIKAIAFYPGHSDPIGGGNLTNVRIEAKRNTTVDFPFSVNYDKDIDPGFGILVDIAKKCGLTGEAKQKLEIDYKLTLSYKILFITINPTFDRNAMIDCPIEDGQIPNIPGFDLDKLAKGFGSKKNSKRSLTSAHKIHIDPILFNK